MTELEQKIWNAVTSKAKIGETYPEILDMITELMHADHQFEIYLEDFLYKCLNSNLRCGLREPADSERKIKSHCSTAYKAYRYLDGKYKLECE